MVNKLFGLGSGARIAMCPTRWPLPRSGASVALCGVPHHQACALARCNHVYSLLPTASKDARLVCSVALRNCFEWALRSDVDKFDYVAQSSCNYTQFVAHCFQGRYVLVQCNDSVTPTVHATVSAACNGHDRNRSYNQ